MKIITSSDELAALCAEWAQAPYITVDTEFLRESTYWPILCLIQVAGPNGAVAIDPLAPGMDLAVFDTLLANPAVLKVFHAGRQDIEIFFHRTGVIPHPVFDSQIAAMVCGFGDSVSYESLVSKLAGAALDKGSRFSDWMRRPLSERQLAYALDDVIHLRTVYESLAQQLKESDRSSWLEEEMAILTNPKTYALEPAESWRRLKLRNEKPRVLPFLQAVAAWRETEAQRRDLPRNRVLRDETIIDIAQQAPKNADELSRIRGLPGGFVESKHSNGLLAAIEQARHLPREDWPVQERRADLPSGIGPAVELLKVLLKLCAEEHNVAAKLLASSSDLELLAADDRADVPALSGWRREVFGDMALKLKHGQIALAIQNKKIVLK